MWMLPLYLHVNKKSDDDEDEQHHWYTVKMLNHRFNNVLHNIAFLTSLQEPIRYCFNNVSSSDNRIFINVQVQGQHPHPLPGSWLAARMVDLIQDLQVCLSWSFHTLQFLSVICFHVTLGLPGSCFPSTCMSKALLTAPMEHSTCPYQQNHFSSRMRYRSSMQTRISNSLDLVVTMSCSLTLQICLIIALSIRCRHWRFGFVNSQVLLAWSIALYTQHLYT